MRAATEADSHQNRSIYLRYNRVLFLDELLEYRRNVLEQIFR
jgi:predicted ATPase with chaperone activity